MKPQQKHGTSDNHASRQVCGRTVTTTAWKESQLDGSTLSASSGVACAAIATAMLCSSSAFST